MGVEPLSDSTTTELTILLRLALAMALGGAIGWEREATGKAAGLRTHMLVGMGATLFVSLAELLVHEFAYFGDLVRFDPARIIEAIVAAMGFLGGGAIFVMRDGNHVKGLTTAASMWVVAAVGIAVGLERYLLAVGSTVLVLVVLSVLRGLEDRINPTAPDNNQTDRRTDQRADQREGMLSGSR